MSYVMKTKLNYEAATAVDITFSGSNLTSKIKFKVMGEERNIQIGKLVGSYLMTLQILCKNFLFIVDDC